MATLGTSVPTLGDLAKQMDPDSKPAVIAEILSQQNAIMDDAVWMPSNLPTGHRMSTRTTLPGTSYRGFNEGIAPTKSTTAQIEESIAMLEAWSVFDKDLADLSGNTEAFLMNESMAFFEAMAQQAAGSMIYGNVTTNPKTFHGLTPRYNSLSGATAQNIINGGGSGSDNTSVWLVGWGSNTVFGLYPSGSQAGIKHDNFGPQVVEAAGGIAGSTLLAYRNRYQWKLGLGVKDWRYVIRICNIDISALVAKSSAFDLNEGMIRALYRIPNRDAVKLRFYVGRTAMEYLDIQSRDDVQTGGQLSYQNVDGKPVMSFRGVPIRLVDQILETEATVS